MILKDQLIRDHIIIGLRNRKLSEKLQLNPTLATEQARQSKEVKKQQSVIHRQTPHRDDKFILDSFNKSTEKHARGEFLKEKQHKIPDGQAKCSRCLRPQHARKSCAARESISNKRAKKGYWAKACRS